MKLIALLPVKDESWILSAYLKNTLAICDEVVALNDHSTDSTAEILQNAGVRVLNLNTKKRKGEWGASKTNKDILLEEGRRLGGTHFLCLDADESVSTNFLITGRHLASKLKPGEKLAMQWLALWKSYDHYRDDKSVWSNNWKDFIVCDSPELEYSWDGQSTHTVGRTPGPNVNTWVRIPQSRGVVLHYQFANWNTFQLKQTWYMCHELINKGQHAAGEINRQYSIVMEQSGVLLRPLPMHWTAGIPIPNLPTFDPSWDESSYHKKDLLPSLNAMFDNLGIQYFEFLNIWHIPQHREKFIQVTGREPRSLGKS